MMNRKHFLSSIFIAVTSSQGYTRSKNLSGPLKEAEIPAYLKPGDTIGITSPAGYMATEQLQPAIKILESWGFNIKLGHTINKREYSRGGTDEERLSDLQYMIDDPNVKAVMCARGGYGSIRIIDQLDFSKFKRTPKWLIGFSDITVFHCHLNRQLNIASIHSKMCNGFPADWAHAEPVQIETIQSIYQVLTGAPMRYTAVPTSFNRAGRTVAPLVGGNLSIIETMAGTKSDLDTDGKILFLEDAGEYLYSIDRMFWNLKRTGKLAKLKGLILGGFKLKPDDPGDEFGGTVYELITEKIKEYDYPVGFDFPTGHQKNNFALKCGVTHIFNVDANGSSLSST